jgi:predicted DCC family thiol-disulfide oxidoreductase YuxK
VLLCNVAERLIVGPSSQPRSQIMLANYPLTLFFDSACPLCNHEMQALKARDAQERLALVDIAAEGFDAAAFGYTSIELDRAMNGRFADGLRVSGLDAIQAAYEAVGLGRVYRWTRAPLVRPVMDRLYQLFAKHRNRLSPIAMPLISLLVPPPKVLRAECEAGACKPKK